MPWEVFDPAGTELVAAAPPEKNVSRARDLFTGENRTEFPEAGEFSAAYEKALPTSAIPSMQAKAIGRPGADASPEDQAAADQFLKGRQALTRSEISPDPKAQLDILRKAIPGLEARPDKYGNVMVKAPGMKEFAYLNAPGASKRDFSELMTQSAATAPLLAMGGGATGPLARAALTGVGTGGASVAQDVMAGELGSEQGIDKGRALLSAGIGAGSAGILEPLIGGTLRAAGRVAAAPVSKVRGFFNPEAEAERRLMGAAKEDLANGVGMTAGEATAAKNIGQDVRVADVGGETMRAEARRAANVSPAGRQEFTEFVGERFKGQGDRLNNVLSQLVSRPTGGGPNAYATREQLKAAASASVGPRYAPAMAKGEKGLMTPELKQLSSAPAVQAAMRSASTEMKNRVAAGRAKGAYGPNGEPTLEFWDLTKRRLGDKIDSLKQSGARSQALDLDSLRVQMTKMLDDLVPEYAAARGTAKSFFDAEDALEAGEKFVQGKFDLQGTKAALAKMTAQERDLFAEGFASRFSDIVRKLPDSRNILNAIGNSSDARSKLVTALGPNRARAIESFLRVEGTMDLARGALGNSTTARQLVELGVIGYGLAQDDPDAFMVAAILFGGRKLNQTIDRRVADRVVKQLLSTDTSAFINGVKQLASSPMLAALRKFDDVVAKAGIGRTVAAKEGAETLSQPAPTVPRQLLNAPPANPGAAPSGPSAAPPLAPDGPPAIPGGQSTVTKSGQQAAIDPAEAYELAGEAIKNGAPIEAVKARLAEYGIDPAGLA